jgi:Arm DNA-binding domain
VDEISGFGLRVFPLSKRRKREGRVAVRSFFFNYRIYGIERRPTIGEWPTWSAEAARTEAKRLRKLVDQGRDPVQEERERRDAPTVQDFIDRYITEHLPTKTGRGEGRRKDELKMLDEIGERLGRKSKVADIHDGDIKKMHGDITKSDRPIRANRILAAASKIFSLSLKRLPGENKTWRDATLGNPCKGVERNPENGRELFASRACGYFRGLGGLRGSRYRAKQGTGEIIGRPDPACDVDGSQAGRGDACRLGSIRRRTGLLD